MCWSAGVEWRYSAFATPAVCLRSVYQHAFTSFFHDVRFAVPNGRCAYRVQDIPGACDEFCAARGSECLDAIAHFAGSCTSDNAVICSFVYDDTMCDPPTIECICAAPG